MARSIWTGNVSFGLVNIPVKLMSAVKDKDISFHQLHQKDGSRIQYKRFCAKEGKEVPWEEIVSGYPIGGDDHVIITDEELERLDPKATNTIDIRDFVELKQIDPAHFEKPYYLVPDARSVKAYALLLHSMNKSGKVAIGRMVMRDKEYLVALRPKRDILTLETMRYAEELVPPDVVLGDLKIPAKTTDAREVAMAEQLISTLATDFEADRYHDEYREKVLKLVDKKAEGGGVVAAPQPKAAATAASDLMETLKKSLEEAKRRVEVKS